MRVRAVPEAGKANDALLKLIAAKAGAAASQARLIAGAKSRLKQVAIAGDPAALMARLAGGLRFPSPVRERGRGEGAAAEGKPMTSERIAFARSLRHQPTPAEAILWTQLRGSRFHGAKFRRQVPFDRYVVDFYCHAAKLAVEIDGEQHDWFAEYDRGRTEVLERLGVQVLRFQQRRGLRRS